MRILVTGGAGFIGSFVAERALAAGHTVRVLDNLDPQVHPGGRPTSLPDGVELIEGDVRDRSLCARALADVDGVVHAAGAVGVAQSMYQIDHYVDVNVRGTAALLEALVSATSITRLVVLTSMTEYGEGLYRRPADGKPVRVGVRTEDGIRTAGWEPVCAESGRPLVPTPTPETATLLSRNVYALSKRYQEELALSLGDCYRFPVVCLRLFNVYGPRQSLSNPYTGVIAIFLARLLAGERPVVYEDGRQTRDFISVHDVAETVVRVLASPAADGLVVNLGSGQGRAIGDLAVTLARLVGRDDLAPDITERFRHGDVRHCVADITRARERLGFAPGVEWETGLTEVVAWARSAQTDDRWKLADGELRERRLVSRLSPGVGPG